MTTCMLLIISKLRNISFVLSFYTYTRWVSLDFELISFMFLKRSFPSLLIHPPNHPSLLFAHVSLICFSVCFFQSMKLLTLKLNIFKKKKKRIYKKQERKKDYEHLSSWQIYAKAIVFLHPPPLSLSLSSPPPPPLPAPEPLIKSRIKVVASVPGFTPLQLPSLSIQLTSNWLEIETEIEIATETN